MLYNSIIYDTLLYSRLIDQAADDPREEEGGVGHL